MTPGLSGCTTTSGSTVVSRPGPVTTVSMVDSAAQPTAKAMIATSRICTLRAAHGTLDCSIAAALPWNRAISPGFGLSGGREGAGSGL